MPDKCSRVKRERQYEGVKDEGMSNGRASSDRPLPWGFEPGRQEVGLGIEFVLGRDHRPDEGCRTERRQSRRSLEELTC